jgi:DNA-binding SARP family transcriptional activator
VSHEASLEQHAAACVLDLRLDAELTQQIAARAASDAMPWLRCYAAFERRVSGDYAAALALGQQAAALFMQAGDANGQARATAEVAIVRYHLGQYTAALSDLSACPPPPDPVCMAALHFAAFLNNIGRDVLDEAVADVEHGLSVLEQEANEQRRAAWRVVLQRNVAAAYHFQGNLRAAEAAAREAVHLAETFNRSPYTYCWSLYELGVLQQRAGQLQAALETLQRVREQIGQSAQFMPLRRWIAVAEGHTLRDMGRLAEAEARFRAGGWGEGDEGPLMLWLLQGRTVEARFAAEAQQAVGRASGSPMVMANLHVFFALLDLEEGATAEICAMLRQAIDQFAAHRFWYNRASALLHLAAAEYALGHDAAATAALAEALHFGATTGYLNFAWWHPQRMRMLLHRAAEAGIEPEYCEVLRRERGLAEVERITLELRCFGQFEVTINGQPLPPERWRGHKAGAVRMQRMLLFLARHREPQPLDAIARYVWADNRDIDMAANFHVTLAALRRALEPDLEQGENSRFVRTTPQGYQLAPMIDVAVDLDQFLAHVQAARYAEAFGDTRAARAAWEQAERLYTGPFALARPADAGAEEYQHALIEALHWLAAADLQAGNIAAGVARARRALHEDRWDTAAPALLIRAYLAQGNRRVARRQIEQFIALHGQPSAEIARLVREHGL